MEIKGPNSVRRALGAACVWLLASALCAPAQETRSMIYGRVLDPQGMAVAGATVVVTSEDTNTSMTLTTNVTGYYEANLLLPGRYRITAEITGFKKTIRTGVVLPVSTRSEVNLQLELGAVTESVSVTAEAPLLDTSTVSSGRIMDTRNVLSLPVFNNSPVLLVKLAPGVQSSEARRYNGVNALGGASDFRVAGGVGGSDWSLDGAPNAGTGYQASYLPYSDTIQEFKVETSNFDASVGKTTGATISIMTKAGTNAFHGTLTEQHWQQRLNAARFFVKQLYHRNIAAAEAAGDQALAAKLRAAPMQPSGHSNNYAATIGGPVVIPRLINGRNKLFFFFSFDGFTDRKPEEDRINYTVPTLANRNGDFSQLLNVDASRYQIYDPLSIRPDPNRATHYLRDPIPGNLLPTSRVINPAYQNYVKLFPRPNSEPASARLEPTNNYVAVASPYNWTYEAFANRIDYLPSEKHRFFGRWSWLKYREDRYDWTYETARGLHTWGLNRNNPSGTIDWVYTPSSSTVFDFVVAGSDFKEGSAFVTPYTFTPSGVGLPSYLDQKAGELHVLPMMNFSGYYSMGQNVPTPTHYEVVSAKLNVSHIRGAHSLRVGFDQRQQFRNGGGGGNTSGNFSFSNAFTRREDDTLTPAGSLGHSWAAFMMGLPDSLTIETTDTYATHSSYWAWYVQDNWRLTPKLTVNLGLRTEYELGQTERYNRMIGGFDPTAKLPITDAAQAAYAARPIPELAAAQFAVAGGSLYPGVGGRSRGLNQNQVMWLPRLGAAYQLNPKTVLRAGYGFYFDTLHAQNFSPDQTGFSRTTSSTVTNNFGLDWLIGEPRRGISPLTDPFPVRADGTRFDAPVRDALGLMARTGAGWSYLDFTVERARQQRWRIGVQRQMGAHAAVEVAYSGSYSDRVGVNRRLDALPGQYWADGLVRNNTIANNLNANVANPFQLSNFTALQSSNPLVYRQLSSLGFFTSPTIRKQQLLRPYPHMNGLTQNRAPVGEVRTDALEVLFERRFSKGFQLSVNYVRMNDRDATFFLNEFDPATTWRESNNARPQRLAGTGILELPFGKGKALARTGVWSALLGGFQIAATYELQPGALIDWGNVFYYGKLDDINAGARTLDRWFNTDGFERTAARGPAAYHRRVFPTRIGGLRADGLNRWDTNIQRQFRLREGVLLELRLDVLDLFNRSSFNGPVTDPFSTNFARVVGHSANTNRFLQIQARIRF